MGIAELPGSLAEALRGSQAIIPVRERTKFTASLFEQLPDLEYISQTGNHAYHVDMEAATRRGVVVSLAPGGNSTTELTFGLMLAVMRRIPQSDAAMRRGEWPLVLGYVLKGKTLGILGLGKIGTEVAAVARAFGMNVIAWGPTLTQERAARSGATFISLPASEARRIGLDYRNGKRAAMETANGVAAAYRVKLDTVRVGELLVNNVDAVVIGCAQALALIPGVSRSGSTLTAGIFRGFFGGHELLLCAFHLGHIPSRPYGSLGGAVLAAQSRGRAQSPMPRYLQQSTLLSRSFGPSRSINTKALSMFESAEDPGSEEHDERCRYGGRSCRQIKFESEVQPDDGWYCSVEDRE